MKKTIAIVSSAFLAISLGIAAPVSAAEVSAPKVALVKASDYSAKKKNQYWNAVRRLNSDARIVGKKDVIEVGVSICDLLRSGGDLYDLAELVSDADPIVEDLIIAAMAAAPVYLCRDQQYKFE